MKLLFDARFIRPDQIDGIGRYTIELAHALADEQTKNFELELLICDKKQLDFLPHLPHRLINSPTSLKELWLGKKLNQLSPDVVFCPMQTMGSFGKNYKLILTIHDLIYYEHKTPPHFLPLYARVTWWLFHSLGYWPQRLLLNRADTVATVSNTTKQLIAKHTLTKKPIIIISNAPSDTKSIFKPQEVSKNLIYMGSGMPYKNVETLLKGMANLPGYTLHILSKVPTVREKALKSLVTNDKQVIFHQGVSQEKYIELLSSAYALVTASKSEGFGLPVIEALKQGTPVVCSDLPIFHEIAGESALFFTPDDPQTFVNQVTSLENKDLRQELIKAGKDQAKKYSWKHSAQELLRQVEKLSTYNK